MRWNPEVTVAAVVERDGRFLMVEERIAGRLVLNQPAGHLEDRETLVEAVIRETREETAWRLAPPNHPVPFSPPLEDAFLPQVADIEAAVDRLSAW